ncbi:MAG: hypothetical protein EA427_14030 [Spirochaetaceae bacterium]|nr:MAG: hypothetical protein EA427_14030 [Spirochaetaceae bacterium]
MDRGAFYTPSLVFLCLGFLSLFPVRPGAETHGSVRTRLDHEGTLTSRAILLYGPSRWFLLTRSSVTLREEEEAPAGYRRSTVRLRSPLEDQLVSLGVEAGPLILGPIEGRGLYHRLRDPTQGGAGWSALTDDSRFVPLLDPEVQDRRGFAFSLGETSGPVGGSVWYLERDDHYGMEGIDWWLSPLSGARLGRFGLLLARIRPEEERFRDPRDDPWLYTIPPAAPLERRLQAFFWEYRRPERFRADPHLLLDLWRQRSALRPPLFAGNAFLALGPPALRGSMRAALADRGFVTLQEGRTRHSRLLAAQLSHRSLFPRLIMGATGRWSRAWGWSGGEPGSFRDEAELSIDATRLRIAPLPMLDRLYLKGRVRREEDDSVPRDRRLESGFTLLFSPVRLSLAGAVAREEYRQLAASLLLLQSAPAWARGRSVATELSGRYRWVRTGGDDEWHVTLSAGVPLGGGWRFSMRSRLEGDQTWTGSVTMEYGW